ncbi:hypothetical protein ACROYT_G027871 [Oculina patagonica]
MIYSCFMKAVGTGAGPVNENTADSHLKEIKNLKFDVPHCFKNKGNEDQYRFNLKVGDATEEAKEACLTQQLDKVHASLEQGEKLLAETKTWNMNEMSLRRILTMIKTSFVQKADHVLKPTKLDYLKQVKVSQIVVAVKKSVELRDCIDPKPLNAALKREHYQIPVIDDSLPDLTDARVFTTADLALAFWHLELDHESSMLTTFATPYGRYRWLRLPFGLSVSSEIFQKRLHQELDGLPGVKCIADDGMARMRPIMTAIWKRL